MLRPPKMLFQSAFAMLPFSHSVQFSSVAQLCLNLCDPMNHSMPGLPVHHQLPESTQTHVHWVSDAIQPFHPLSSPSPAFNLSQHQGLFKWVSSSHHGQTIGASASTSVLWMNTQDMAAAPDLGHELSALGCSSATQPFNRLKPSYLSVISCL